MQQQRDGAEVPASAEVVLLVLDTCVHSQGQGGLPACPCHLDLRFGRGDRTVQLPDLGTIPQRGRPELRQVVRGVTQLGVDFRGIQRLLQGAVAQKIHVAAGLRLLVERVTQLLLHCELFGSGPQHLVARGLPVAVERLVHADVFVQEFDACANDLD